uniref:hypothetical protein n=1 Tax=Vacuolaria virescens TaxID=44451 RepID=UPI0021155230|nr:hypothetical protein NQY37_pgp090 [Vacuolaria virescens]UTE94711.1 hypothetical protein VvirPt_p096 [Vacuolaria virescens]
MQLLEIKKYLYFLKEYLRKKEIKKRLNESVKKYLEEKQVKNYLKKKVFQYYQVNSFRELWVSLPILIQNGLYKSIVFSVKLTNSASIFLIRVFIENSKSFYFFLTQTLTKGEFCFLLIFVIVFVYTDRMANKTVKYEKTLAPNWLWRIAGFVLYVPIYNKYVYQYIIVIVKKIPAFESTFAKELEMAIIRITGYEGYFERLLYNKLSFFRIYQVFLLVVLEKCVRFVPKKYIYMPMFIRYHMTNVNILSFFCSQFLETSYTFLLDSLKKYQLDSKWSVSISCLWLTLYIITVGRSSWDALRGKSFTKTSFDTIVRLYLGQMCLYKDEKWKDFGMDEVENEDF